MTPRSKRVFNVVIRVLSSLIQECEDMFLRATKDPVEEWTSHHTQDVFPYGNVDPSLKPTAELQKIAPDCEGSGLLPITQSFKSSSFIYWESRYLY
ncbi:hypothetical protein Tco_0794249 [Tanacetum coccineum]